MRKIRSWRERKGRIIPQPMSKDVVSCGFQMLVRNQNHKAGSVWKTETGKTITPSQSALSPLQISWMYILTRQHSLSQAFSRHTGSNFTNSLKLYILLVFSTSCPRVLSFFTLDRAWEKKLHVYLLTLKEGNPGRERIGHYSTHLTLLQLHSRLC